MTRAELAAAVTALVVAYVDQRIDRALELALAQLTLTEGAARRYDVRTKGQAAGSRTQRRSEVDSPAGSHASATRPPRTRTSRSTRARRVIASKRNGLATSTRRMQPSVNPALQQGQDLPPSTSTTTPATAEAAASPTSRELARSPASSPISTESPPPYQLRAPVARSRADIEAAAARLRVAARPAARMDAGARPPRGAARPIRTDVAEEVRRVEPALPEPLSTFTF